MASGIVDYTEGSLKGLQTGFVNYAGHFTGVQVGFVNYAAPTTTGASIGIINLFPQNRWFTRFPHELAPGMVIVNWRYYVLGDVIQAAPLEAGAVRMFKCRSEA